MLSNPSGAPVTIRCDDGSYGLYTNLPDYVGKNYFEVTGILEGNNTIKSYTATPMGDNLGEPCCALAPHRPLHPSLRASALSPIT